MMSRNMFRIFVRNRDDSGTDLLGPLDGPYNEVFLQEKESRRQKRRPHYTAIIIEPQ